MDYNTFITTHFYTKPYSVIAANIIMLTQIMNWYVTAGYNSALNKFILLYDLFFSTEEPVSYHCVIKRDFACFAIFAFCPGSLWVTGVKCVMV